MLSWKVNSAMLDKLPPVAGIPYLDLSDKQKVKTRRTRRYDVLDKVVRATAGSDKLKHQEALVHDRLKYMHSDYSRYDYAKLSRVIKNLAPLEKFTDTDDQNKLNRYKYSTIVNLANKLCGYTVDTPLPKVRAKFLQSRFPAAFHIT